MIDTASEQKYPRESYSPPPKRTISSRTYLSNNEYMPRRILELLSCSVSFPPIPKGIFIVFENVGDLSKKPPPSFSEK